MNLQLSSEIYSTVTSHEEVESTGIHFIDKPVSGAALMSAPKIQKSIDSDEMKAAAEGFVKHLPGRYKDRGPRIVNSRFIGGTAIAIRTHYYARIFTRLFNIIRSFDYFLPLGTLYALKA